MTSNSGATQSQPTGLVRWVGLPIRRVGIGLVVAVTVIALTLNIAMALLPFFGYQPTAITGGSMAPAIHAGDLVITRAASPETLQAGDVITYRRDGTEATVTHRIIHEQTTDGVRSFTTKGDANEDPDPIDISFSSDVQRVELTVPYAGYFYTTMRNPRVMLLLTALPAIGLMALLVMGMGKPSRPSPEPTGP